MERDERSEGDRREEKKGSKEKTAKDTEDNIIYNTLPILNFVFFFYSILNFVLKKTNLN